MANQWTKRRETEAKLAEKAQRQEFAGIPDSQPSVAAEREETWRDRCHLGGIPVLNLPPDMQARLSYEHTDEGSAEADEAYARKLLEGRISRIQMESDETTEVKRFGTMKDQLLEGAEPWQVQNPMQAVLDAHTPPGHRGRLLDAQVRGEIGMDGWKPVIVDGQKVECGQLFLASMPEERARARETYYENLAAQRLAQVVGETNEQADRLAHAQGRAGTGPSMGPSPVPAGLHITRDIEEIAATRRE